MPGFTKKEIKSSFLKLLNEQPLKKISVRDIVEECGINRNTFYYHFQDIPALIEEIIIEETNKLIEQYPTVDSFDVCVDSIISLSLQNRKAILNIFHSVNRNIFEENLMKLCATIVTKYVYTLFGESVINEQDRRICIWCIKCELFGILIDVCLNGLKEGYRDDIHRLLELIQGIPNIIISQSNEDSIKQIYNGEEKRADKFIQ